MFSGPTWEGLAAPHAIAGALASLNRAHVICGAEGMRGMRRRRKRKRLIPPRPRRLEQIPVDFTHSLHA
jgi:hypothetical protein